ncbi:hypothetical protein LLEC1_08095 [Akanthomyces lecanii]|uniref:Uncharacterized protein n=1 Tax=Cordyceps confragosa TaxID=2714763 RepID=A0A179ITA3_CORDF|nr:hypothetical protein LLEC1_08095 [Akanthomyces lecanii]
MAPRRPPLHPTRSLTTLPLEPNAAKSFTSATSLGQLATTI